MMKVLKNPNFSGSIGKISTNPHYKLFGENVVRSDHLAISLKMISLLIISGQKRFSLNPQILKSERYIEQKPVKTQRRTIWERSFFLKPTSNRINDTF